VACHGLTQQTIVHVSLELVDFFLASKGFWSKMLGVGDFYYELGVQIVEVCMATSHRNGGMH